jgi:hypothetical protein
MNDKRQTQAMHKSTLGAPQNLKAEFSNLQGAVDTRWDPVLGAASYILESATGPDGPWTQVAVTVQSRYLVTGLKRGVKYYFRVRAVGAEGPSPWSAVALKRAA